MPRSLDIESWNRRHHFDFFRKSEDPFFNLCTEVDVTKLFQRVDSLENGSFFLASLWISLIAANQIESFRYRLDGDSVLVFDTVDCGSTVLRDDQTFGFGYFRYTTDYAEFATRGEKEVARVRKQRGELVEPSSDLGMIYYSVIPWVSFSSFSHARNRGARDSIPRIVFGKHHRVGEFRKMPISVEAHHALMDGLHVAQFLDSMQNQLDDPSNLDAVRRGTSAEARPA